MPHDGTIHTSHDNIPDFAAHPTIRTVADGVWGVPATWDANRVPNADDIVSVAHNVIIDGEAIASVIGITGGLAFYDGSRLTVATLLSNGGTIWAGEDGTPISCEIIIRDKPLDTTDNGDGTFDPFQFGTGIICIDGALRMCGHEKTAWVSFNDDQESATLIEPEHAPVGWEIGDRVVIPDTRKDAAPKFEQLEQRSIAMLATDSAICVEPALNHTHYGARDAAGNIRYLPHVANLTRSIVIRSENPQGTRGHIMCVGACAVDVRYVQFKDLGRTTAKRLDNTIQAPVTPPVYSIGENQVGRYSLHLHHLRPPMTDGPLWNVEGCVFDGSPRWGLAIHDTHYGLARGNVAFDCVGAGFVTEDGSETGNVFDGNMSILCRGSGDSPISSKPDRNELVDTAHEGSGFWARASRNTWRDNISVNCRWAGWNIFSRAGHVGKALPVMVPKFKGAVLPADFVEMNVRQSVPFAFANNEAYACGRGFEWWYANVAVLESCRTWHIGSMSLFFQYHGTAVLDVFHALGGDEGIVGQHGTFLDARNVDIDGHATPLRFEFNKRGARFEDVSFDGELAFAPVDPVTGLSYKPILPMVPAPETTLSGIVTLQFPTVTAGKLVVNVNGKKLATDSKSPYEVKLDTTKLANGTIWITAELGSDQAYASGRYFVAN